MMPFEVEVDQETARRIHEWEQLYIKTTIQQRLLQVRFASVMCTCQPWFDRDEMYNPWVCPIHSRIMHDEETGRWI